MVEVGQQSGEVFFHHVGEFDEMLQADASRLIDPGCEEGLRQFSIRKAPEHVEIFFQEVGLIQGLVDFHQFHESFQGAGACRRAPWQEAERGTMSQGRDRRSGF